MICKDKDSRKGIKPEQDGVFFPVAVTDKDLPLWYGEFFDSIKSEISLSRRKVVISANSQMMMMYYHIGLYILRQQEAEGWGAKIIDSLSVDIKKTFPEQKGFSPRNLKYMRKFAEIWPNEEIVQRCVAQLSWRHNICLMEKVKEPNRRLAYAMAAYRYGWSHNILELQLEAYTLEREGKLPNNFDETLPDFNSDMMQYLFKDPFLLDFTGADAHSREKDIEDGLSSHIEKFLLELGQGFSYVGRQVHLEVGGDDFYIDMLFYHLKLRCFVVVELKAVDFNPGMMGQLAMYFGFGRFISANTRSKNWGKGVIDSISKTLRAELPGLRGFGVRNLKNMRSFYEAWNGIESNSAVKTAMIDTNSAVTTAELQEMSENECDTIRQLRLANLNNFQTVEFLALRAS